VKRYLKSEFEKLLGQEYIGEWISVHLEFIEQKRVNLILGNMSEFVQEYK
jgi:hypothetical protein